MVGVGLSRGPWCGGQRGVRPAEPRLLSQAAGPPGPTPQSPGAGGQACHSSRALHRGGRGGGLAALRMSLSQVSDFTQSFIKRSLGACHQALGGRVSGYSVPEKRNSCPGAVYRSPSGLVKRRKKRPAKASLVAFFV